MAGKAKAMSQIKQLLRLYKQGKKFREMLINLEKVLAELNIGCYVVGAVERGSVTKGV